MKIIFLDFDGPILTRRSYQAAPSIHSIKAQTDCVAALNRITDTTDAKIVISSTWRLDGLMKNKERLHAWGVTGKVRDATPSFPNKERGHEIQAWLDENRFRQGGIESFVILDDDTDMGHLLPRLIQTPPTTGLSEMHADAAIRILNRPYEK